MRNILLILSIFAVSGCVTPMTYKSVRPEWNPEKGIEWARAECESRSSSASGYDWIDTYSKRSDAFQSCMKSFGYELKKQSRK